MGCLKDNWQVCPQVPGFLHPAGQHRRKPLCNQKSLVGLTSPVFPAWKKSSLYPEITDGTHQPGVPSTEESPLVSRSHWWDSPARCSRPECCCLVWKRWLPWAWTDGEGRGDSHCADTAALEQHSKSQPRSTARSPPPS